MKAISLATWVDKEDGHEYRPGDPFPHDGREIAQDRITSLTTSENGIGKPVVKVEKEEKTRKK